jgi:hypothetical protein
MIAATVALLLLLPSFTLEAAPVGVKLPEGNLRGFLVLRSLDGTAIAYGELRQHPRAGLIESRLLLEFLTTVQWPKSEKGR